MRTPYALTPYVLAFSLTTINVAAAEAVSIRDIVELTKAGLADDIIVALIDADRTVFELDARQIVQLRDAGVSQRVLLAMLESRQKFDPAASQHPIQPLVTPVEERVVEVPVPFAVPVFVPVPQVIVAPRQTVIVDPNESRVRPGRFINNGFIQHEPPAREVKSIWKYVARDPRDIWRTHEPPPEPPTTTTSSTTAPPAPPKRR